MKSFIAILLLVSLVHAIDCGNQDYYRMVRTYKGEAYQEAVYVYEGSATGTLILYKLGLNMANTVQTYEFCANTGIHTVVATDSAVNGWADGSRFEIYNELGFTVLEGNLDILTRKEWTVHLGSVIPTSSFWKYSAVPQADSTWANNDAITTSWASYLPGIFPATSTMTRYYKFHTILPTDIMSSIASIEIAIKSADGVIIYVDGSEKYRFNLPEGAITANTPAVATEDSLYRRVTIIAQDLANLGSMTIAVEIHGVDATPKADDFIGYAHLLNGPYVTRTHDGTIESNHVNDWESQKVIYLFDDDINTEWYFNGVPAWADYVFNNGRKDIVNAYSVTSGVVRPGRFPTGWAVYGSNDGENYVLLDYRANIQFAGQSQTLTFPLTGNTVAFNRYRLTIMSVATNIDGGEVAEFQLYSMTNKSVPVTLSYGSESIAVVANMDNVYLEPTVTGFSTFTIEPELPTGFTMSPLDGIIRGTPTEILAATTYTVTGIFDRTQQSYTTTFSLAVTSCDAPHVRVDVIKYTNRVGYYGNEEYLSIYDAENNVILNSVGTPKVNTGDPDAMATQTYKYCFTPSPIRFHLEAADVQGWDAGSTLTIKVGTGSDLYTAGITGLYLAKSSDFNFLPKFEQATSSVGLFDATETPDNWKGTGIDTSSWTPINAASPVTATKGVWFIRQEFNIESLTNVKSFEYRMYVHAGSILYIDGEEVYRFNVAADLEADPSATATAGVVSTEAGSWMTYTGSLERIPVGTHVFAVASIPFGEYAEIPVDFVSTLRLVAESDAMTSTLDLNLWVSGENNTGDDASFHIFDHNYYSHWLSTADAPQARGRYPSGVMKTVNYYCITKRRYGIDLDPLAWTIVATNAVNTGNWVTIDTQSDIEWGYSSERKCYMLPNQKTAYYQYKLQITRNPSGENKQSGVAEWEWYTMDFTSFTVPALAYTSASANAWVDLPFTTLYPSSSYYKEFSITPELPAGLSISASTGAIKGTPTSIPEVATTSYTVTATSLTGVSATTTVSITISACTGNYNKVVLSFTGMNTGNTNQVGFALQTTDGVDIERISRFSNWMPPTITKSYCLTKMALHLVLMDSTNDGWSGQNCKVKFNNDAESSYTVAMGESPKTIVINAGFSFDETVQWKYLPSETAPESWKTSAFDDSTWSVGAAGSFTGLTTVTVYYRYKFTVPSLYGYTYFQLNMKLKNGAAAYINNNEIYRYHLAQDATATTEASAVFDAVTSVTTSGYVPKYLHVGENILAVEVHRSGETSESTFAASFTIYSGESKRMIEYDVSSVYNGYNSDQWHETYEYAFDGKLTTKFNSNNCGTDNAFTITYKNGRRENVNKFIFYFGTMSNRLPSYFKVSGSNDGENYVEVYRNSDFVGSYSSYKANPISFYNIESYNSYKFRFYKQTGCTEGVECGELEFFTNTISTADLCEPTDTIRGAVGGELIWDIPCAAGYSGTTSVTCANKIFTYSTESCTLLAPTSVVYAEASYDVPLYKSFTIVPTVVGAALTFTTEPALPAGITIDATGTISGTPVTLSSQLYTITATNTEGSITTTVTINFVNNYCSQETEWVQTLVGEAASLPCVDAVNYEGSRTRTCTLKGWSTVLDTCTLIPLKLSYISSSLTFSMSGSSSYTPVTLQGAFRNPMTIAPALPAGLTFDATSGVLAGTGTAVYSAMHTITLSNTYGSIQVPLTIAINNNVCLSDGEWPSAVVGTTATMDCPDTINYTGSITRPCNDGPVWGAVTNTCVLNAPTITYSSSTLDGYVSFDLIPMTPTITGLSYTLTISPVISSGVTFNAATGELSGKPTAADTTVYTITATNAGGNASFEITFNIIQVMCAEDGAWPATNAGSTASVDCGTGYTGTHTRLCKSDVNGVWAEAVNACVLIPPTITYTQATITGFKNIAITSITPSITGLNLEPLTISPSIPAGLDFNTVTGVISGTATVGVESTVYTITAKNAGGSATATVTISITVLRCSQNGNWPETEAGETASLSCGSGYSGSNTRVCNLVNPATWAEPVNSCVLITPTITLSSTSYFGYKNFILNSIIPSINGASFTLSISPAMTHGLDFNTATGVISGTPNEAFESSSYTITITNSAGSNSATFSLSVSTVVCPAANGFPETEAGQTAHLPCDQYYSGTKDRQCMFSIGGIWTDIIDNCVLDAPTISYETTTYSFFKDDAIERIGATTTGLSFTVSSNPTLPAGLYLDSYSGSIQGTPIVAAASADYIITIINSSGSSQATITLEVKLVECPADDGYPVTERGTTSYIDCSGASGVRTRSCLSTGYGTASWGVSDVTGCVVIGNNDQPGSGNVFVRIPLYLHGLSSTDANKNSVKSILRNLIVNSLTEVNIPASNIIIESVVDASTTGFYENIAKYNFRINTPEASAENVKDAVYSYATKPSGLLSALSNSESEELRNVSSIDYKADEVTVQQNGLTTQLIIIIIVVVVVVVVIIVIIIIVVVCKNKKSTAAKPKIASHKSSTSAAKKPTPAVAPAAAPAPVVAPTPAPAAAAPAAEANKEIQV